MKNKKYYLMGFLLLLLSIFYAYGAGVFQINADSIHFGKKASTDNVVLSVKKDGGTTDITTNYSTGKLTLGTDEIFINGATNSIRVNGGNLQFTNNSGSNYSDFGSVEDGAITRAKLTQGAVANLDVETFSSADTLDINNDVALLDTATGFTLTLPTAVGIEGKEFYIKKISGDSNTGLIEGDGTETIDGALNFGLYGQWEAVKLVSDNSNWQILEFYPTAILTSDSDTFNINTAGFATNEYAAMTNNFISLPPGSWEVTARVRFNNAGGSDISVGSFQFFAANGANNATIPAALSTAFTDPQVNAVFENGGTTIQSIRFQVSSGVISNTATASIFGVPNVTFGTAGSGNLSVTMQAKRVR